MNEDQLRESCDVLSEMLAAIDSVDRGDRIRVVKFSKHDSAISADVYQHQAEYFGFAVKSAVEALRDLVGWMRVEKMGRQQE